MKKLYTAMVLVAGLAFCSVAAATVSVEGTYGRVEPGHAWGLTFRPHEPGAEHGTFQRGSYSIKGDEITFSEASGAKPCSSSGRYIVHETGGVLEFRDGADSCEVRLRALDKGMFRKGR
jgi:opacity protein-like surface antigen